MQIKVKDTNQIVITFSKDIDKFDIQRIIEYIRYLEATIKSKAKQSDIDKLADEVNASWWDKNNKRLTK